MRVAWAVMLLAVADGSDSQEAARAAGRTSGDAVSHLVARFNREGLAALDPRRGHKPTHDASAQARILREIALTPTPDAAGTATWSLSLLRRVLRAAPDGMPTVSTFTVWGVLRGAGYTSLALALWLLAHGVMPLYTPLGRSWRNMAESIQRVLKRRALDGEYPASPGEIIARFGSVARYWNAAPTPFVWAASGPLGGRENGSDAMPWVGPEPIPGTRSEDVMATTEAKPTSAVSGNV